MKKTTSRIIITSLCFICIAVFSWTVIQEKKRIIIMNIEDKCLKTERTLKKEILELKMKALRSERVPFQIIDAIEQVISQKRIEKNAIIKEGGDSREVKNKIELLTQIQDFAIEITDRSLEKWEQQ